MVFPVLKDKVAIVTGAAMGMGEATAKLFVEAKAKVVVADLNVEEGQKVVSEIKSNGGTVTFIKDDISNSEQVRNMVNASVETFGRLDVAVNNVALAPDDKPVTEFDEEYWD